LIQIALVGNTPIVVEEGIRKGVPEKLYIIHTKDESHYKYEKEAKKLKQKIETNHKIPTKLVMVNAFDMDDVIQTILKIIAKERKESKKYLERNDFAINLTGGTKLMVAAAATAAYLAGARVYYVKDSKKARDEDVVLELPVPSIPRDDSRGNTSKTTSIVLQYIKTLGKTNNSVLLKRLNRDKKIKKLTPQKLVYHLKKLETNKLITISRGWVVGKNPYSGKLKINKKLTTIELTNTGDYYAEFPDLVGNIA